MLEGNSQRMLEWWRNWSATAEPAALLPRAGAVFPESAGRADRGSGDEADRGLGGGAGADARDGRKFSEEDLTRYLQLSLDLFNDLQASLQPRLHLEIGLLRLVHAGRLLPIEQALGGMEATRRRAGSRLPASGRAASRGLGPHRSRWTRRERRVRAADLRDRDAEGLRRRRSRPPRPRRRAEAI